VKKKMMMTMMTSSILLVVKQGCVFWYQGKELMPVMLFWIVESKNIQSAKGANVSK